MPPKLKIVARSCHWEVSSGRIFHWRNLGNRHDYEKHPIKLKESLERMHDLTTTRESSVWGREVERVYSNWRSSVCRRLGCKLSVLSWIMCNMHCYLKTHHVDLLVIHYSFSRVDVRPYVTGSSLRRWDESRGNHHMDGDSLFIRISSYNRCNRKFLQNSSALIDYLHKPDFVLVRF